MNTAKIGAFLASLRKEKGLTQEQLGEKMGVSNKTVSRWETGNYLPPVEMMQQLSSFYGITINEILSGERLSGETFLEKAEENLASALKNSSFTLEEKTAFYKEKWKKDHLLGRVLIRILISLVLIRGIVTQEVVWCIGYFVATMVYYCIERNRMMIYVEDRAFDGSGNR